MLFYIPEIMWNSSTKTPTNRVVKMNSWRFCFSLPTKRGGGASAELIGGSQSQSSNKKKKNKHAPSFNNLAIPLSCPTTTTVCCPTALSTRATTPTSTAPHPHHRHQPPQTLSHASAYLPPPTRIGNPSVRFRFESQPEPPPSPLVHSWLNGLPVRVFLFHHY